jgi:hypothetical protein
MHEPDAIVGKKTGWLSGETGKCRYALRAPPWEFGKFRTEKNAADRAEVERA